MRRQMNSRCPRRSRQQSRQACYDTAHRRRAACGVSDWEQLGAAGSGRGRAGATTGRGEEKGAGDEMRLGLLKAARHRALVCLLLLLGVEAGCVPWEGGQRVTASATATPTATFRPYVTPTPAPTPTIGP